MPPIPEPEQVTEFRDRLSRLNRESRNVIWVGSDEAYTLPNKHRASSRTRRQRMAASIGLQLRRALVVFLGFAAYGAWVIVRYRMTGLANPIADRDIAMGVNFAAAFLIATLVGRFFGIALRDLAFWKAFGAAAGVMLFHDLVFFYPDIFAQVVPHWTRDILAHSKPATLFWRGDYYQFYHF